MCGGYVAERDTDMSMNRMTSKQLRSAKALIKKLCCNYDTGDCILLDCPCPQMHSYTGLCKWFKSAILPQDKELLLQLISPHNAKRCSICGSKFIPTDNRALYCDNCRKLVSRRKDAERKRKKRHMSAFKDK